MHKNRKIIGRFTIEFESGFYIGTGQPDLIHDNEILWDWNGLPYIPGTSIAGVIRSCYENIFGEAELGQIFGNSNDGEDNYNEIEDYIQGKSSDLVFSSAHLVDKSGKKVVEEYIDPNDIEDDPYYSLIKNGTKRDHVRITHKGAAADKGKFDELIVPKGARFVFEIEFNYNDGDQELDQYGIPVVWNSMLQILSLPTLRFGAGTRKGLGKFKVISAIDYKYNFDEPSQLELYLNRSVSLNSEIPEARNIELTSIPEPEWASKISKYQLELEPKSYFIFGSGESGVIDNTFKRESFIHWDSNAKPEVYEDWPLIPASSIKGALAHRVAYHYNKSCSPGGCVEDLVELAKEKKAEAHADICKLIAEYLTELTDKFDHNQSLIVVENVLNENLRNFPEEDFKQKYKEKLNAIEDRLESDFSTFLSSQLGVENKAVYQLFGSHEETQVGDASQGAVVIDDVYVRNDEINSKIFEHVKIDRYTGGAYTGALFQEEVLRTKKTIKVNIFIDQLAQKEQMNEELIECFEKALTDICSGSLLLGGMTQKGHGQFKGEWKKINL